MEAHITLLPEGRLENTRALRNADAPAPGLPFSQSIGSESLSLSHDFVSGTCLIQSKVPACLIIDLRASSASCLLLSTTTHDIELCNYSNRF